MKRSKEVKHIQNTLLKWFCENKRDFPWRRAGISNYELIMSEILLQRTKAQSVANYYHTFFRKYPDWQQLCNANYEELVSILKPLGLQNQRALRILKLIEELNRREGKLPTSKLELNECNLGSLYISNAFQAFVLRKSSPLLDVNMARILVRYFGIKPKSDIRNDRILQEKASIVIDVNDYIELNWAFLDFSALVCRSQKPLCNNCTLKKYCKFQG